MQTSLVKGVSPKSPKSYQQMVPPAGRAWICNSTNKTEHICVRFHYCRLRRWPSTIPCYLICSNSLFICTLCIFNLFTSSFLTVFYFQVSWASKFSSNLLTSFFIFQNYTPIKPWLPLFSTLFSYICLQDIVIMEQQWFLPTFPSVKICSATCRETANSPTDWWFTSRNSCSTKTIPA
jgi:hypothetical protein